MSFASWDACLHAKTVVIEDGGDVTVSDGARLDVRAAATTGAGTNASGAGGGGRIAVWTGQAFPGKVTSRCGNVVRQGGTYVFRGPDFSCDVLE